MALVDVNKKAPTQKASKGGLFGKIAGGVIGGVAGTFTGVGTVAGASAGAALGGLIGSKVKPGEVSGGSKGPSKLENAASNDPSVQLAGLKDAQKSSLSLPRDQREQVAPVFSQAEEELKRKIRGK